MRKVKVFKYERTIIDGRSSMQKREDGAAWFHTWGVDWEEFEQGVGTFSTAIIERDDGSIENIPTSHIQFITDEDHS